MAASPLFSVIFQNIFYGTVTVYLCGPSVPLSTQISTFLNQPLNKDHVNGDCLVRFYDALNTARLYIEGAGRSRGQGGWSMNFRKDTFYLENENPILTNGRINLNGSHTNLSFVVFFGEIKWH